MSTAEDMISALSSSSDEDLKKILEKFLEEKREQTSLLRVINKKLDELGRVS